MSTKPIAIYVDATGERIGELGSWDAAHEFAHEIVRERPDLAPLAVEDRMQRTTRFVHARRCELVVWSAFSKAPVCDLPAGSGDGGCGGLPRVRPYVGPQAPRRRNDCEGT